MNVTDVMWMHGCICVNGVWMCIFKYVWMTVLFLYTLLYIFFAIHNFHILLWSKCILLSLIIILEKENLACRGEGKSSMHTDVVCWSVIIITFCYFSAVWVWAFGYDAFAYCFWYGARRIRSKNRHLLA